MATLKITCLRADIRSGSKVYPIFNGFASAVDIRSIAETPSFSNATPHDQIGNNILTPPVKDWQRPLDTTRVATISHIYSNTGELMPNAVLLCENTQLHSACYNIAQQTTIGGVPTAAWEVIVDIPATDGAKPLWILDGQHRINGLAGSAQSDNQIPVVLLLNHGCSVYAPSVVAKLFAQVTTEASPLDNLHHDWLTFAFRLRDYSDARPNSSQQLSSMETVAELCRSPELPSRGITNPFYNRIRFNPKSPPVGPQGGGFQYTCSDLKEIIREGYYGASVAVPHIQPRELAGQIAVAYMALVNKISAPHQDTVFFGAHANGQTVMQHAFLDACLKRIGKFGLQTQADWEALFNGLQFPTTNWKFDWTSSLNGANGSISRAIASSVLSEAFVSGAIPSGSGTIADFLKGNEGKLVVEYSKVNTNGRVLSSGRRREEVKVGNTITHTILPAAHFKIVGKSTNIGKIDIIDKGYPSTDAVSYRERGELIASPSSGRPCSNPLRLVLRCHHYGATKSDINLDIRW
jgi:hypothetical protein